MSRIEQWEVVGNRVEGFIFDHERYPDGATIKTAQIILIDEKAKELRTARESFKLGKPKAKK